MKIFFKIIFNSMSNNFYKYLVNGQREKSIEKEYQVDFKQRINFLFPKIQYNVIESKKYFSF